MELLGINFAIVALPMVWKKGEERFRNFHLVCDERPTLSFSGAMRGVPARWGDLARGIPARFLTRTGRRTPRAGTPSPLRAGTPLPAGTPPPPPLWEGARGKGSRLERGSRLMAFSNCERFGRGNTTSRVPPTSRGSLPLLIQRGGGFPCEGMGVKKFGMLLESKPTPDETVVPRLGTMEAMEIVQDLVGACLATGDRIFATESDSVSKTVLRSCGCFLLDPIAYNHGLKGLQEPKT